MIRKKSSERSREYSESIVNTVREPLIILDGHLRVVSASRSFYEVFKVKPEDTVGQLVYDLGNKQWDIPRLRQLLEEILPQKATFDDYEVDHVFPDIGRRIMLLNARRIPRPPQKLKVILLAIEDITERKGREEHYLNLAAIVNTSIDGIIGKTLQGDIVSWNKAAEKIYGYTEKEVLGQNITLLAPAGYEKEMLDQLIKLRDGELIKNHETKRVRKDGVVIDVSLTLSSIKDKLGNIYGVSAIMHDLTEQQKAKQELIVSEYSESIINTVREPLIVLDQALRVVTVSRSFYEVFKVKPEETVGQLIYDLGNKQWDIPKLRELLETILPQKTTFDNYEVEHDFATIGRRIMLLNARQIEREKGKERIILLAIEDISNRRKLEEAHSKLAAIVESADDAIIDEDLDGTVISWNRGAEIVYGYSARDIVGKSISLLMSSDHPNEYKEVLAKIARGETIQHYETQRKRKDGKIIYISMTISPVKDTLGKIISASTIARDFTMRREIEAGLEKTRKELEVIKKSADEASEFAESVINTVREPLISLDQDLRVVTVSRSFYEFFKVKPEETVGQLIYDLGNKQWDIPKLRELLETILPQKTTFDNYEVEHDFTTIGRRTMLLNARQIERVLGKERIILLAIEDITKRKEIEAGLVKAHEELTELASELKRTAKAKSEFLANMSHELRTPLNSINGFSEVLYDETFGPLNAKQRQYVNNVLTSGKHLLLLINQILDMAKVEAGKMSLALSNLPMKSLLNDLSMLVADMVSKKRIEMLLEINEDLPNIEADDLKVKEIVYNLLSNAVKFTPEGGKIGMRAKKADFEIEVVVWDTGVGIAPENMEKIFEGFFRVDTPYSRVTEGTGLGLPLSKKLVELHGGQLYVESEGLNKGTSVRFTLPIVSRREV